MVVDDSVLVAESAKEVLSDAGYDVRAVTEVDAVLPSVLAFCPDLLLLDVSLPGTTGDRLAVEIQQRMGARAPRILLFSAMDEEKLEALGKQCGAAGVVTKRGDNRLLVHRVRAELEGT